MRIEKVLVLTKYDLDSPEKFFRLSEAVVRRLRAVDFTLTRREFELADRVEFRHKKSVKVLKSRFDFSD